MKVKGRLASRLSQTLPVPLGMFRFGGCIQCRCGNGFIEFLNPFSTAWIWHSKIGPCVVWLPTRTNSNQLVALRNLEILLSQMSWHQEGRCVHVCKYLGMSLSPVKEEVCCTWLIEISELDVPEELKQPIVQRNHARNLWFRIEIKSLENEFDQKITQVFTFSSLITKLKLEQKNSIITSIITLQFIFSGVTEPAIPMICKEVWLAFLSA